MPVFIGTGLLSNTPEQRSWYEASQFLPLPLALAWRRDNTYPLLASFIGEVQRLPDVRAVNKG